MNIFRKYNVDGTNQDWEPEPEKTREQSTRPTIQAETQVHKERLKRKLFCKDCKNLFAVKVNGKLQIMRTETNSNCEHCLNPHLDIVCRVCNLNIKSPEHYNIQQKHEHIIKHLDSDKHYQKEQAFDLYQGV